MIKSNKRKKRKKRKKEGNHGLQTKKRIKKAMKLLHFNKRLSKKTNRRLNKNRARTVGRLSLLSHQQIKKDIKRRDRLQMGITRQKKRLKNFHSK